jgi:CRISPR-associated protein Cmr4
MTTDLTESDGAIALYSEHRFLLLTLDPVHVGTGGYRLGRVDMSIVREPGTNVPKVPGTTMAGASRSYAAMRYGKPEAAGQHRSLKAEQKERCPIIYTFGTTTDTFGGQAGTVSIGDARILLFPVHSMVGPIWVATADTFEEAGFSVTAGPSGDESVVTSLRARPTTLNLGWLLLDATAGLKVQPPADLKTAWSTIAERIALVSSKLFSHIVNSNLEIRTSVSIDPETGAAAEGALFTYEAIPRATWLWCDVVEDDYRRDGSGQSRFPEASRQFKSPRPNGNGQATGPGEENAGESLGETWRRPMDVVRAGIDLIEYLGVGGMGTRGFGRLRRVHDWSVTRAPDGVGRGGAA